MPMLRQATKPPTFTHGMNGVERMLRMPVVFPGKEPGKAGRQPRRLRTGKVPTSARARPPCARPAGTFLAPSPYSQDTSKQGDARMSKANPKSRDPSPAPDDRPQPVEPNVVPIGRIPPLPADQVPEGDDLPPGDQGRVPPV